MIPSKVKDKLYVTYFHGWMLELWQGYGSCSLSSRYANLSCNGLSHYVRDIFSWFCHPMVPLKGGIISSTMR